MGSLSLTALTCRRAGPCRCVRPWRPYPQWGEPCSLRPRIAAATHPRRASRLHILYRALRSLSRDDALGVFIPGCSSKLPQGRHDDRRKDYKRGSMHLFSRRHGKPGNPGPVLRCSILDRDVRFGSLADIAARARHVRSSPQSRHSSV